MSISPLSLSLPPSFLSASQLHPLTSASKLPRNTLLHEQGIRIPRRRLTEHIAGREPARGPALPAEIDVRVRIEVAQLAADVLDAVGDVAAARLREEGLAAVGAQVGGQRGEVVGDVIRDAVGVGAGAVAVEVLVDVVDELGGRAVGVLDGGERGRGVGDEAARRGVVGAGEQDELRGGAGGADGGHHPLQGDGPRGHGEVVGLVHRAEDDVGLAGVLGRELAPDGVELRVRGAALPDDAAVPAGVVVQVDDAVGAGCQAGLHELIVAGEEGGVEGAAERVGDEVLPAHG